MTPLSLLSIRQQKVNPTVSIHLLIKSTYHHASSSPSTRPPWRSCSLHPLPSIRLPIHPLTTPPSQLRWSQSLAKDRSCTQVQAHLVGTFLQQQVIELSSLQVNLQALRRIKGVTSHNSPSSRPSSPSLMCQVATIESQANWVMANPRFGTLWGSIKRAGSCETTSQNIVSSRANYQRQTLPFRVWRN